MHHLCVINNEIFRYVFQHCILQTLAKPGGASVDMWCASFIHIDEDSLYPTPGAVVPITGGAGLISTLLQSCLPRITALPVIAPAILLFHNIICFVFCFCILGFLPEHRCRRFAEMFYHFCSRQIEASLALIISRHSSSIVGSDAAVMENF